MAQNVLNFTQKAVNVKYPQWGVGWREVFYTLEKLGKQIKGYMVLM